MRSAKTRAPEAVAYSVVIVPLLIFVQNFSMSLINYADCRIGIVELEHRISNFE